MRVLIQRSGQIFLLLKPSILSCHTFLISSSLRLTHKLENCYLPKLHQQHPSQTEAPTRPRLSRRILIPIRTDPGNGIQHW